MNQQQITETKTQPWNHHNKLTQRLKQPHLITEQNGDYYYPAEKRHNYLIDQFIYTREEIQNWTQTKPTTQPNQHPPKNS